MIHLFTRPIFEKYANGNDQVIELGDQLVNYGFNGGANHIRERTIDYYTEVTITSIDNRKGADRALNLDLSKPIAKNVLDSFEMDMLTDFGTIEHVKSLYHALKNAFSMVREGGLFIHSNPKYGNFPAHNDYHKFSKGFWVTYANTTGMELVEIGEHPAENNTNDGWEVYAVLKKTKGAKFPAKKAFDAIYKEHITPTNERR